MKRAGRISKNAARDFGSDTTIIAPTITQTYQKTNLPIVASLPLMLLAPCPAFSEDEPGIPGKTDISFFFDPDSIK